MKKILALITITFVCLLATRCAFAVTTGGNDPQDNGFQYQGGNGPGWNDWDRGEDGFNGDRGRHNNGHGNNHNNHHGNNHHGQRHHGHHHGVVPEPVGSVLFLFGSAALGLNIYRRRKKGI